MAKIKLSRMLNKIELRRRKKPTWIGEELPYYQEALENGDHLGHPLLMYTTGLIAERPWAMYIVGLNLLPDAPEGIGIEFFRRSSSGRLFWDLSDEEQAMISVIVDFGGYRDRIDAIAALAKEFQERQEQGCDSLDAK